MERPLRIRRFNCRTLRVQYSEASYRRARNCFRQADLVAGDKPRYGVILLFKPSDVFVCNGALQPWLEWRRTHPGALALVFTRDPTPAERIQLATFRVHPDGVLRRRMVDALSGLKTPSEMLLVRGRMVSAEVIKPRVLSTPLYRRLTSGT